MNKKNEHKSIDQPEAAARENANGERTCQNDTKAKISLKEKFNNIGKSIVSFISGMNKKQRKNFVCILIALIIYGFVVYGLLLVAPLFNGFSWERFNRISEHPDIIYTSPMTLPVVGVGTLIYAIIAVVIITDMNSRNFRHGIDHGDAKWGNVRELNKRYVDENPRNNRIITNNLSISLSDRKTGLNNHQVIIGGSGAGKSRYSCIPNLMQMSGSYIVLDSKRELLRTTGEMFRKNGYVVKVLNLIDPTQSDFFNPFKYIRKDEDVIKIAHNLIRNTSGEGSTAGEDKFFEDMCENLLIALMFVVYYEGLPGEQNFGAVMDLFHELEVKEDDENFKSPLHYFFIKLEKEKPYHPAIAYWKECMGSAAKTIKSIMVSLARHMAKFNSVAVRNMMSYDNLELEKMGERPTVLFACIPDNDNTFNFIVSQLYSTLFDVLYYVADEKHFKEGQRLPYPVSFLMDEFYNVAVPENFTNIIGTCRSRNIFLSIYLQDKNQLDARFEKEHKIIFSNCDIFVYLGGNSLETMEYISKLLGEETIDTRSYGQSKGASDGSSKNDSSIGIALMSVSQVRRLSKKKAIVFIKGEDAIIDFKYDSLKHPNADQTQIAKAPDEIEEFVVHESYTDVAAAVTDNIEEVLKNATEIDATDAADIVVYSVDEWISRKAKKGVSK